MRPGSSTGTSTICLRPLAIELWDTVELLTGI
jgi:hypothetical protein